MQKDRQILSIRRVGRGRKKRAARLKPGAGPVLVGLAVAAIAAVVSILLAIRW